MNKYLLHVLLLLGILASCSRNNEQYINSESQNQDIQFNISIPNVATRSAAIVNSRTELDGKSVGLYAFMTNSDASSTKEIRAENVKLTYNKTNDAWEYADGVEPLRWNFKHTYDKFSFYVYYPYEENATNVNFDMESKSFSINYNAEVDKDVDVMIAQLEDIVCPSGGIITIDLKHILSAITFNTDYTKPIEDVKLCSFNDYHTMPMKGTASLAHGSGDVEWSNVENYTSDYSYSLGNKAKNYALIIPQTTKNKGNLYFSMSYNDGTGVDNNAKIPANMEFKAGEIYTFKYKGSYVQYDEETGDLIIDIDAFNALGYTGNEIYNYESIGAIIDQINAQAEAEGKDVTLTIAGTLASGDQAYHILRYIVQGIDRHTGPDVIRDNLEVNHYDFSKMIINPEFLLPYDILHSGEVLESLKSIKLPVLADGNFGSYILENCTALERVEFAEGSTLTQLKDGICRGCTSLKEINLDILENLTDVSQEAFKGCTALEEIKVPQQVTTIGYQTFYGCTNLNNITLETPSQLKEIKGQAFYNCKNLESIKIPATVTTFGWQAFYGSALKIYNPETGDGVYFEGDPKNITSLADGFNGCTGVDTSKL